MELDKPFAEVSGSVDGKDLGGGWIMGERFVPESISINPAPKGTELVGEETFREMAPKVKGKPCNHVRVLRPKR